MLVSAPSALELMDASPGTRIMGTVRLPTDEEHHPYGQWSAGLERADGEGQWYLTPLVPEAFDGLPEGAVLIFYRGVRKLATLFVLAPGKAPDRDTEL